MAIISKVGVEAEYLLIDEKGELTIPPSSWDRDGFPLLGEIRGKEGSSVAETVTNFKSREMEIVEQLYEGHSIRMAAKERVPLKLYKKANRQVRSEDKENEVMKVKNIYGLDITEFSDQIIEKSKVKAAIGMKIQGVWISCGLHIHFSCAESVYDEFQVDKYENVILPIGRGPHPLEESEKTNADRVAEELSNRCIYLYRKAGYKTKKKYELHASRLNKPAIEFIVREMDKAFFDKFAPPEGERTKYRHAGFFELKPYGFEYRSLPATAETMTALPDIVRKAFDLLKEINEY